MQTDQILALAAGPDLDRAVHSLVFAAAGPAPKYSTDWEVGAKLLRSLPLFVAHVDSRHAMFSPTRTFVAGSLAWDPERKCDVTTMRVAAATELVALCKAALIMSANADGAQQVAQAPAAPTVRDRMSAAALKAKAKAAPRIPQPSPPPRRLLQTMPVRPSKFAGPEPAPANDAPKLKA